MVPRRIHHVDGALGYSAGLFSRGYSYQEIRPQENAHLGGRALPSERLGLRAGYRSLYVLLFPIPWRRRRRCLNSRCSDLHQRN